MEVKIVLLGDRLLLKKIEIESTESWIILTDSLKENNHLYEVVQVSDKITDIFVGDTVCIWAWSGDDIILEWTKYRIVQHWHILGVTHKSI